MRIIMGIGYCLEYMHHDRNPPVVHTHVHSMAVMLTDDYAAKVHTTKLSICLWKWLILIYIEMISGCRDQPMAWREW